MDNQITLYSAKICPYAHRVEIAMKEANVDYTRFEVDLQNKPSWYAPKVNPASKVPAIAYGGPPVPPDQPSPESAKLAESAVLLEFITDLHPESNLLPSDPVQRAKARFFIDAWTTRVAPGYVGWFLKGEPFERFMNGLEFLQTLLPPESEGKYALGNQFSIADAAVAPFAARFTTSLKNDLGVYETGEVSKCWKVFQTHEKFGRVRNYFNALLERPSVQATYDEDYIIKAYTMRFEHAKAQRKAAGTPP